MAGAPAVRRQRTDRPRLVRWDKAGSGTNGGPPGAIFVAGHSEGGIHATRLAAVSADEIRGVPSIRKR